MTRTYRGDADEQSAVSKFWRDRYPHGALCVIDADPYPCSYDYMRGIAIEWKHASALDRSWTITRRRARRLGWPAALFVYDTDDGRLTGTVTRIVATWMTPTGRMLAPAELNEASFDRYVLAYVGGAG